MTATARRRRVRILRYWPELALAIGAVACGVAALVIGVGPAKAAEPTGWHIVVQRPGEDWQPLTSKGRSPWMFSGPTACNLDLASQANVEPAGTRLACVRAEGRQAERR